MGINLIIWQIRARMIAKGRFKRMMENLESTTGNLGCVRLNKVYVSF
jgi:hypothetical protein